MKLIKILKFIYNHPYNQDNKLGGVVQFIKWQFNCILNPFPIIYRYTENSKIIISKGLSGATGNLYCGLMEYEDMGFLLHFLRTDDLFVDIGANVGAYTILASSEIKASTIAIEPIPSTFNYLMDNIYINQIHDKVDALNIGLGAQKGSIAFTNSLDCLNHVATPIEKDTIEVPIYTLDSILSSTRQPILIKIDVEGFETEVLNGANNTLMNDKLKAIIIELNGSGIRYGYDEYHIHTKLLKYGFEPFRYNPKTKELIKLDSFGPHNTIYLRDSDFVGNRLKSSREIKIGINQKVL